MAVSLEAMFLLACKNGDIESVRLAISLNVDVNYQQGWPLRRAIRYNHPQIWDSLLLHRYISVNLCNQYGLSALHTAARFNLPSAVADLLRHPGVSVNEKTLLGSSPLMVAVKYCSKQSAQILVRDKRVDLDSVDNRGRTLEDVIGTALTNPTEEDKLQIAEILQEERSFRELGEGRRPSLEEEGLKIDGTHRTRVFGKLKELLEELSELHKTELLKIENRQEEESRSLMGRMEEKIKQLIVHQEQERTLLTVGLMAEKEEMSRRQQEEVARLLHKQEEETMFLQRTSTRAEPEVSSPKPATSTRRPSLVTGTDRISQGGSPWEGADEGYLTSKEAELPEMITSACKELECPICMEVMAPPSRIWQCKMGHVICEPCKERVSKENGSDPSELPCPTCKTAPFIGRNLALERVARSLFTSK